MLMIRDAKEKTQPHQKTGLDVAGVKQFIFQKKKHNALFDACKDLISVNICELNVNWIGCRSLRKGFWKNKKNVLIQYVVEATCGSDSIM